MCERRDAWFPLYDLPLGEPRSNATLVSDGVWRRVFASVTSVGSPPSAQKERAVDGARTFVTYYYYYYY